MQESSLSRIQLLLRDKQQRSSFQDTQFAQGDANGDGLLQRDELRSAVATVCSDLGISLPSSEKIDLLFAACDTNHDGGLSPDEFRTFVGHVLRAAASTSRARSSHCRSASPQRERRRRKSSRKSWRHQRMPRALSRCAKWTRAAWPCCGR